MVYVIYPDEMMHHGVKGMKWGVRKQLKYERKAQKWGNIENRMRTRTGKNLAGTVKLVYKHSASKQKAVNNAKTRKERLQQKYGAESSARNNRMQADIYKMKSARARTNIGRKMNANLAYNNESMAKHYDKVAKHSPSTIKRAKYSAKKIMKTPLKTTYRGKQTTFGKELAKAVAYQVAVNVVTDMYNNSRY